MVEQVSRRVQRLAYLAIAVYLVALAIGELALPGGWFHDWGWPILAGVLVGGSFSAVHRLRR